MVRLGEQGDSAFWLTMKVAWQKKGAQKAAIAVSSLRQILPGKMEEQQTDDLINPQSLLNLNIFSVKL